MNLPRAAYSLTDDINNSVKNWTPSSEPPNLEAFDQYKGWSAANTSKEVMLTMQTGQVFAAEPRRISISPGTRGAALAARTAGQWDTSQCWLCAVPSATFWDCHT